MSAHRTVPVADSWYLPAQLRGRPSVLELALVLPPLATVAVTWQFQYVFLHRDEHRPDANRGFDVPAAFVTFDLPSTGPLAGRQLRLGHSWLRGLEPAADRATAATSAVVQRIYSTNAVAPLPTPDFSMPYNVITMTSTVIALAFGMLFNLLTRDFVVAPPAAEGPWWQRLWRQRTPPAPAAVAART